MKSLVRVASLCTALFALAPIASASAEKAAARCSIEGRATFLRTNLKPLPTPKLGYEFHGPAVCETLPGRAVHEGRVDAEGEETLSCAGSLGEAEGKGTLTLGELKLPFGLRFFLGSPGSTALSVTFADGSVAVGAATFLTSKSEEPSECFTPGGARYLQFKAVAIGEY